MHGYAPRLSALAKRGIEERPWWAPAEDRFGLPPICHVQRLVIVAEEELLERGGIATTKCRAVGSCTCTRNGDGELRCLR